MPTLLRVIGSLLAVIGIVWILQGIGVLPGSFMTGQLKWAGYGILALVAGVAALVVARRVRRG